MAQNKRLILFLLMIALGAAAGLALGWGVFPRSASQADLPSLRLDYKTDAVLMIAEIYQQEGDIPLAIHRLGMLGDPSPVRTLQAAILQAEDLQYSRSDLNRLVQLLIAVQGVVPPATTAVP